VKHSVKATSLRCSEFYPAGEIKSSGIKWICNGSLKASADVAH